MGEFSLRRDRLTKAYLEVNGDNDERSRVDSVLIINILGCNVV
jgi:hypothetical protein